MAECLPDVVMHRQRHAQNAACARYAPSEPSVSGSEPSSDSFRRMTALVALFGIALAAVALF